MSKYDHAVIGAGIVGTWTALRLLSLDKTVLLLDQFSKPYTQNSSQGNSRIIRIGHKEDFITKMMPISYDMWKEVETYTKKELIIKCGFLGLESSTENNDDYREYVKQIKAVSPENFEELTTTQLNNKYALKFKFESLGGAYLEKSGGSIMAKDALLTIQDLFRKRGGHFWDACKVHQVIPEGDKVKVATEKGDIMVNSVVVCAGPWTQKLLTPHLVTSLPLQPLSVKGFYWKEKVKGVYDGKKGFPAFLHISE
ncbi:Peroxisomal sarcosine oxidase, partial [Stegodyphus mimosarum]